MAYNYEDSGGWLAQGPSIGGSKALLETVEALAPEGAYPNLHKLLNTGECDNLPGLVGEATRLAAKVDDADVKSTLLRLARAASSAKDSLIVTH